MNAKAGSGKSGTPRLAVLIACHNRVAHTVRCIEGLKSQKDPGMTVDVFLVDDGSDDGTSGAVARIMPAARILHGSGDLYWSGGVRLAFARAMEEDYDYYLWLNDDTVLDRDALSRLAETHRTLGSGPGEALIVVGSTRDPVTGAFSYGGWRRRARSFGPRTWTKIPPDPERPTACDTINGNCVLIPRAVVRRIGNIDAVFRQGLGDLDYGLRAVKNGCRIMIAAGYFGTCSQNDGTGFWTDRNLGLLSRWNKLIGPKGLPISAWRVFTSRHKGPWWPASWLAPYILLWFDAFRFRRKRTR